MADDKKKKVESEASGESAAEPPQPDVPLEEGGEEEKKPSRLSRLRFKKKDMPGGLWLKCPSCSTHDLPQGARGQATTPVPSACSFHFTVPGPAQSGDAVVDPRTAGRSEFAEL